MKPSLTAQKLKIVAWGISIVVALLAFVAWGQAFAWQFNRLSTYRLFPLFGLLAFSLMWSHYVVSVIRTHHKIPKEDIASYFEITSLAVLAFILLHPALLIWQLWRDGYGLPPESYKSYVAPGLVWVVLLGTISWLIFLAYELRRKYADKDWWRYVQYASDIAMVSIFYHSLRLGSTLQRGWFHDVWLVYGLSLIASLAYLYLPKKLPS